jgi:hypothetical protein
MKKLECDCDPAICKDVVCSMVPVRRSFIRFTFGSTPLSSTSRKTLDSSDGGGQDDAKEHITGSTNGGHNARHMPGDGK